MKKQILQTGNAFTHSGIKKNLIKFGLLGTISVFLVVLGCQQDDFFSENQSAVQKNTNIELKEISFSDLKTNLKVLQKIKEVSSF